MRGILGLSLAVVVMSVGWGRANAETWGVTDPAVATVEVSALMGLEIKPGERQHLPLRLDAGTTVGQFTMTNTSTVDIGGGHIGVTAGAAKYLTADGKSLLFVKKDDENQHIAVTVTGEGWTGPEVHNGVAMWILGSALAKGASTADTLLTAVNLTTNTPGEYETQLQATLNNI
ncbi:hypothetical protein [Escherichia coli]|uniref:hypothetical protein n=1 Tax=Escherichia coli TaxID=562 RepID=UPI00287A3A46|nr:hypothetical protein [Escherichia coli]MDS1619813.1 hypothetical protein [Escherichia coli]